MARGIAAVLNLIGFVMMLLATLSTPVVKSFDFLSAKFPNGETMRAGIWGKQPHDRPDKDIGWRQ